ncbi:ParB/RepB/Spo0J family partition protein [Eubacteriales bacterium OttesenSCG-928-M02]|nr:ParB/RepB/Spo0J family partition protein [Eubacteriales bacterium OttesenSCG-928-M02]
MNATKSQKMKEAKSFEDLFKDKPIESAAEEKQEATPSVFLVEEIGFFECEKYGFSDPFLEYSDERRVALTESIMSYGIIDAVALRPSNIPTYKWECISGRHRIECAKSIGLTEVPGHVLDVDDNTAIIMFLESNIEKRPDLTLREKANAFQIKLASESKQGKRTDITQEDHIRNGEALAEKESTTKSEMYRIASLTKLVPEFWEKLDQGKMSMYPASLLASIPENQQNIIATAMQANPAAKITVDIASELKRLSKENKLNDEAAQNLLVTKEKQGEPCYKGFRLPEKELAKHFPPTATAKQVTERILKALEYYAQQMVEQDAGMEI